MRLPEPDAVMRITMSSVKPNQRLRRSLRPARRSSAASIVHPILCATSSARSKATSRGTARFKRSDVRIGLPLLVGNLGAFIGDRVSAFGGSRRDNGGESRRIVGIGRDVVDRRHGLPHAVVMPRHIGDQEAHRKGQDCHSDPAPINPGAAEEQRAARKRRAAATPKYAGPRHQRLKGDTKMPPSGAPADRTERRAAPPRPPQALRPRPAGAAIAIGGRRKW